MNEIKSHPKYQYTRVLKDDSEKKFYILGLLAADGYINEKTGRVELALKKSDGNFLEHIKNQICPQKTLKYKEKQQAFRFQFDSKDITENITKYFIVNNKSKNIIFPTAIPNEYIKPFIRGYIDGDGNIGASPLYKIINGKKTISSVAVRLRILGTKDFLLGLTNALRILEILNYNVKPQKKGIENVYYISYVGGSAIKILNWIYKDSIIHLPRKKAVYNHILNSDNEKLMNEYLTIGCHYNTQMSEKYSDKDIVESLMETSLIC